MPLVVPLLRILLLFLNVYETFKTLQLPKRSPRTGEPTVRAVSQRKRDMKGCMTIWLVWCAFTVLERTFDNILSIFVPFYNEFKGLIYVFQIVTRARGAEPVYLHVLRPLVKPYVTTLDWSLDLMHMVGDFILLVLALPYHLILEWRRPPTPEVIQEEAIEEKSDAGLVRSLRPRNTSNDSAIGVRTRSSRSSLNVAAGRTATAGPSRARLAAKDKGFTHSKSDTNVSKTRHEIWLPSESAFAADSRTPHRLSERRVASDSAAASIPLAVDSVSTPPNAVPNCFPNSAPYVDEWRLYPPFPSAYPPTPCAPSKSLSDSSANSAPAKGLPVIGEDSASIADVTMIEAEVEEWRQYPPFPSAYPPTPQKVAKALSVQPSLAGQSALESVAEKDTEASVPEDGIVADLAVGEPTSRRETRSSLRQVPSATQSLPTRTGRRTRLAGFSPSLERPRESSVAGSSSRGGSSDESRKGDILGGLIGEGGEVDTNEDEDDMDVYIDEEEDDNDFDPNITLRTPARRLPRHSRIRLRSLTTLADFSDEEGDVYASSHPQSEHGSRTSTTMYHLAVPSTTRTNSNYTLSSYRNSWGSSKGGSLTTVSRASSLQTMSRAPSTISVAPSMSSKGSRSSGKSSISASSDTNSVAGVKRPISALGDSDPAARLSTRPIRRAGTRSLSREPSIGAEIGIVKSTKRAAPAPRTAPASKNIRGEGKGKEKRHADAEEDTLESSDGDDPKRASVPKASTRKRRRIVPVAAAASSRMQRADSTLQQVPEESIIGRVRRAPS